MATILLIGIIVAVLLTAAFVSNSYKGITENKLHGNMVTRTRNGTSYYVHVDEPVNTIRKRSNRFYKEVTPTIKVKNFRKEKVIYL